MITSTHRLTKKADCIQNCPVLLNEDQQFSESINFHTGCKQAKCVSNLNLEMYLQTQQNYENPNATELIELNQLLIGFHQYSILNVRLTNQDEQAYSTYLELVLRPSLQIKKIESRCKSKYHQTNDASYSSPDPKNSSLESYLEIVCYLGNPFERGSVNLQFVFDLFNTELDAQSFKVNGSVHTTSELSSDSKVHQSLNIPIRRQVGISLKE